MISRSLRALILPGVIAAVLVAGPVAPATAGTIAAAASSPAVADAGQKSATPVAKAKKAKKFKNCTALSKVYKGGVAKPGVKANKVGGKKKPFKVKPTFSKALYTANSHLDRDKDGIACEK